MVRGCYGGMEVGVTVPTATSAAGCRRRALLLQREPDAQRQRNRGQFRPKVVRERVLRAPRVTGQQTRRLLCDRLHAAKTVGINLKGTARHCATKKKHWCNLNENGEARQNVGNTATGFTGSIYCHSDYDKSGMRKIMADSKWSKVHLSNDLEATVVGTGAVIGGVVLGPLGGAVFLASARLFTTTKARNSPSCTWTPMSPT